MHGGGSTKYLAVALVFALLSTIAIFIACVGTAPAPPQNPIFQPTPSAPKAQPTVQPPNSPSGLIGEQVSQTAISLQWIDNSNNEDGFNVYRDGTRVATVKANTTIYQDTGLKPGKTYHYIVKAYNSAGESGTSSCTARTLNPPLNVTINYIGVKFDHDPLSVQGPGDIRLVLLVTDGTQTVQEIIPPGEGTYPLNDYETMELNQRIFHASTVGDYLKICIIAYDDDPETLVSDMLQAALPILGSIVGMPTLGDIGAIFSQYQEKTGKALFENKDDYVGYFEGLWSSDESWGIGQHEAVGIGDFRIWLSILSENQPAPGPKPVLLPDVTIESVDLPAQVEVGKTYTYHVRLRNSESNAVAVTLKWQSSIGTTDSQSVTVPASGFIDVTFTTKFEPAGVRTITYTLLYQGGEIASLSKTVEAK